MHAVYLSEMQLVFAFIFQDVDNFIQNSGEHGVIYFSLGVGMKGTQLPNTLKQLFLRTFACLKQNVLWKYEDLDLENIPDNVMVRSWFPQQSILGKPSIICFFGSSEFHNLFWG